MRPSEAIKNPFSRTDPVDQDRRAEIYRVAAQIICEKGFEGSSMNQIAEAAGITKSGLYHHIPGKRKLLFQIMNFGLDALEEEVIAPARAIRDPEQRLRAIITTHARLITSRSTPEGFNPVTIVVDEVAGLTAGQRTKINQRKRAYLDFIRNTLGELQEAGKLRDLDIGAASFSLLGMILWLSRWYVPTGRLTPEQVSEEVLKVAIGGLLRGPAAQAS